MRKKYLFITLISCLLLKLNVNAASGYLTVSKSSIENGSSVTATAVLSDMAAWNVKIISSGSTSGCSNSFADATSDGNNTTKYLTVTCKSIGTGIINFVLTGDVTSSDGTNVKVSSSKSVTVVKPREKSTNNDLKSLSVEGYEITPEFNKNVREYRVNVPSTVDKITINATKADGYASLTGDGEKEVEEGANLFEIIVTSETGVSNKYTLTVNVEDVNPIEVKIDGKKYTLVKNPKNLVKPELFEEKTIKINEVEIPAFYNGTVKRTLVGLKDESGKIKLFIYDKNKYILYNEYKYPNVSIIFLDMKSVPKEYKKSSIRINGELVDSYKVKGDSRYLVYGQNLKTGETNYYTYDGKEKTLQLFNKNLYEKKLQEDITNEYIIYALSGALVFMFIILLLISSKNKKYKKFIKLQDEIKIDKKDNDKEEKIEEEEENILDDKPKKRKSKKKNDKLETE